MSWWQWLLAWTGASIILGPLLGRWLEGLADQQTQSFRPMSPIRN